VTEDRGDERCTIADVDSKVPNDRSSESRRAQALFAEKGLIHEQAIEEDGAG